MTVKEKKQAIENMRKSMTPLFKARVRARMSLAARLDDALIAKGWTDIEFAKKMGQKNTEIVAKWLSGTHNFTLDLLVKLEQVLDIKLLITEPTNKPESIEKELPSSIKKSKAS